MSKSEDLAELTAFIDNFRPEEFSSGSCPPLEPLNLEARRKQAAKIKGRLLRKKQMEESFLSALAEGIAAEESVTITQEEIDELLANI